MSNNKFRLPYALTFGVSLILRFSLILFNREANDSHEAVANLIIQSGRLPQINDCWECFQPKLYHLLFAELLKLTRMENNPAYQQNVAGQFINFIAGLLTLAIIYIFIRKLNAYNEKLKFFAFALIALNPALIWINSQATNDTLVIFFSTLSVFLAYKYLEQDKIIYLFFCLLSIILGISAKTNAWVSAAAIIMAIFIKMMISKPRTVKMIVASTFLLSLVIISFINPLNQYISNYQKYGTPILMNIKRDPFPHFSGGYSPDAAGIWYIGDGFFTFRFIDLIRHPYMDTESTVYLPHQTSLWTVLFARAHSIHFDNAPPSSPSIGKEISPFLRILYCLAIIPTALIILGFVRDTNQLIKGLLKKEISLVRTSCYGLFMLLFLGFITFQALFSFQYRSQNVIKAIFIYPALMAFPVFFIGASDYVYSSGLQQKKWISRFFDSALVALLLFYCFDVILLIRTLVLIYIKKHPF